MNIIKKIEIKRAVRRLIKEKIQQSRDHQNEIARLKKLYDDREITFQRERDDLNKKMFEDREKASKEKQEAIDAKARELEKEFKYQLRAKDATIGLLKDKNEELEKRHRNYRELRERNEVVADILATLTSKLKLRFHDLTSDVNKIFQDAHSQLEECDKIDYHDKKKTPVIKYLTGGDA